MQWMFLIVFYTTTADGGSTEQLSEIRTAFLQKYKSYHDVGLMQFEVPRESAYVRFEFTADDAIPGCKIEKVLLYIKHNSPPVINPDGSKFPSDFKKIARPKTYYLEATGNTTDYLMVSPYFGYYYVSAVLPYVDPKYTPIQPPGLTRECKPFVQGRLLWSSRTILSITEVTVYRVFIFFPMCRFYIPEDVSHVTLFIDDLKLFNTTKYVVVRVQAGSFPSQEHSVKNLTITTNTTAAIMRFNTKGSQWYYLKFYFNERIFSFQEWSKLKFTLKYFHEISRENLTSSRIFSSDQINQVISYQLYNLVMDSSTESFSYFYRMYSFNSNNINVNSTHFVALQFKVRPQTDIGGTLRFQLSFESGRNDLQVIACIRPGELEVPTWPNLCVHNDGRNDAPLVLNATMTESSMLIPFPEAGVWFATFRLFCGECAPCKCPESCQNEFKECLDKCESTCIFSECNNCTVMCKIEVLHKAVCEQCDCDGPCIRHDDFCNSTVTFDIGSTSCVDSCGPHGRCMLFVGDGVVYASCLCLNNYRGWDCSDGSNATPYYMIVIEFLLLVLSNLIFLFTVYVAYRRRYYAEAVVYFSTFFFSTCYHACDAGENTINFCITSLESLQFADFYCALFSIWVTLIAIADLPSPWSKICHVTGAIVLSFTTTINKRAMWGLAIPTVTGIAIIFVGWFIKWWKIRKMCLNKRYLYIFTPLGVAIVGLGVTLFVFLETIDNYMYLHSAWHIMMGVGVAVLLPRSDTFNAET